ncbi:[protein-PII] uridylyltransferase [Zavarzinia sp. CC-PAN008]|uniref:[protein-PII] uridylyltransferase n=1 Tax=Zavarzinia sp. CC-PAN008 TaxID=3243332 RepID=UPI003F746279
MDSVRNPRALIDRARLLKEIDALQEVAPDTQTLRNGVVKRLKQALLDGRAEAQARLNAGTDGRDVARSLSYVMDQTIRILYDFTVQHLYPADNPTKGERVALVALGGYGRGELAPFSDVDLLFLVPWKQTPWCEQVAEAMLYALWDLGLKVGHSTRSVDEALRLSLTDTTIRTATLEARWVWGDRALYDDLKTRFRRELQGEAHSAGFVAAKLAERDERHRRQGDTRYVVEPNLKEGKGGLRDLHTLWWIAKHVYAVEDTSELVRRGILTPAEHKKFNRAESFLWDVRCHLHFLAGRAEERLTFDVQPELSRRLGYTDHAGTRGVERFMKHYFLVAKDVGALTRIFSADLAELLKKKPRLKLMRAFRRRSHLDGFTLDADRLAAPSPTLFEDNPREMIRVFHTAQRHGCDIHPRTLGMITRNLKRIDAGVRADPEANALFLDILTARDGSEATLRLMNEAGVFGRFVPDFGRVVAQMQYDMYHHYTVDEHTIRAIGILSQIERGELKDELPLASELFGKVVSRRALYVAVLLHDIAKGRGRDHSVVGAEIADRLCPRLGLTEAETEMVAWLVRHHLLMSDTAFKRDVSDPKTVEQFADQVQSPEFLRMLLILTAADIRAVGPGVWNGWKGQLLRTLYAAAEDVLLGGQATEGRATRVQQAKEALALRLADWPEGERQAYLKRHYDPYWLSDDVDALERHARLIREADLHEAPLTLVPRVDRFRSVTEVTLYTADHPGLFARVTGAMAVVGASIVDAKINTTADSMALDVFWIQDSEGHAFDRLARLSTTIDQVLSGRLIPREALAKQPAFGSKRMQHFEVVPRVLIDNTASDRFTVVEVHGRDRPGILFELTRALFELNLTIASAHIATYGARAVDTFYVSDFTGHRISHASKLKAIERRLMQALVPAHHVEKAEEEAPVRRRRRSAAG